MYPKKLLYIILYILICAFPGLALASEKTDDVREVTEVTGEGTETQEEKTLGESSGADKKETDKEETNPDKKTLPENEDKKVSREEKGSGQIEASPREDIGASKDGDDKPSDMEKEGGARQKSDEPEFANPEQLTYPGVTNKLLQKGGDNSPTMSIYFPQFGNDKVDRAMADFAKSQVEDYEGDISEALADGAEKPASFDMWDMTGFFTLDHPNPDVASILFNVYSYSGGAHGMLQLTALNYDLKTGKKLEIADLFSDPQKAIGLFAEYSAKKLRQELGADADEDMINSGTAPEENNFQNLTLTPGGLFIEFQPYQVGPWSIGPQRVEMTLEDLKEAGPNPEIWPKLPSPEKN